jgi:TolB-like protein/Tfp pilus assembly protein PilF/predicted Ser/Thr protein kinase
MIRVIRICRKCGAKIFSDAPEGLCPRCVLKTALGDFQGASVAGVADPSNVDKPARAATTSEHAAELLGELGDYELLEEVGRGGQGVVFRARQKSLNRIVALKVISLGQWASKAHLRRFRREAEAAARLEHPGIVPIHEVGERDGSCYFSMKFVEGGQLDAVVKREPMPIRQGVELIAKVARTVRYAHEHGILHRDIKPGNILLDQKGEPHLTDFGLARLIETESTVTRTLEVLGTPSYMAPEQAVGNNDAVSSATDVYGLGAVLYQLLTGHPPFAGGTTYETIKLLLDTEPRQPRAWNPKIDRDLSTICLKCLEKDPKRRYSSALALAEDLEHWLKHEPIRARRTGVFSRGKKWVRRNPSITVMAAMLLALAMPLGVMVWKNETEQLPASNLVTPEKSIAVLPFSNLSKEPENAFFADGVQDEILTDLARIADLKVISRTSVMHYKSGTARNLREIGQQLGVANVVEGSVQRSGNRVRVNAQLVDARTDRHLWAETYDRDLADVFAIQSEIAKTIAEQLQAKLSLNEKNAIERPPTSDITAFDLYTRAKNILLVEAERTKAELLEAVDLLNQAVAHDPSFFDGYCQLAYAHGYIYFGGSDPTSARLASADAAIQAAARLRPDAGETHLGRAQNLYWGYRDYDSALAELEVARQTLPNDFRVPRLMANIQRRRGQWEESRRNYERAAELNPRDILTLWGIAHYYTWTRRYADAKSVLASALAVFPNDLNTRVWQAYVEFQAKADTRPWHQMLDSIRATSPAGMPGIAESRFWCALAERDAMVAKNALDSHGENPIYLGGNVWLNRPFMEGVFARMTGDDAKAQAAFTAARTEQEKIVQTQPNFARALVFLGLIDAGLGRKEEALREGRRAVELLPVEKDALDGVIVAKYLAVIAAWVGDKDFALDQLASIIRRPSDLSYGDLKLLPFWDPLRGDPRFEKILGEAKQPVAIEMTASSAPEQSIAVLPFENLSDEKEHAFFADGVQDDILTKLAKIADLKVISRTSVMQYRGKQNTREIGDALHVSHVLEGSVRRVGARIHLNAQLIDTRTDTHVWAEEYDRDLNDVFATETEVAQAIANRLKARISASEKLTMAERPTKDLVAYDLYVRATGLIDKTFFDKGKERSNDYFQALDLLNQAVARDPDFLLAYCRLAEAHDEMYFDGVDRTPNRLALAKAAIDSALHLKPDSGEAHLALANHFYHGYFGYDQARDELAVALRTLPNDGRVFGLSGAVDRRQNRWHDAVRNFERAMELDPRNIKTLISAVVTYELVRDYGKARATFDRLIALEPSDIGYRYYRSWVEVHERADFRPVQAVVGNNFTDNPSLLREDAGGCFRLALWGRNPHTADNVVVAITDSPFTARGGPVGFSRAYAAGLVARMKGDNNDARAAFTAARTEQDKVVRAQPDDITKSAELCSLGLIDAALGRKQEALSEGGRAVELLPLAKNALDGADILYFYAVICAQVGERVLAIEQLKTLAQIPAGASYGELRLDPFWDPLRGDLRFEKIVASLAPK